MSLAGHPFLDHFWSKSRKNPEKTPPEKHPEIDAEKVRKNMKNHAKNMQKVGPKSMEKRLNFAKVEFG